eukprot:7289844-Alexandrium_andersonii.AAC.1
MSASARGCCFRNLESWWFHNHFYSTRRHLIQPERMLAAVLPSLPGMPPHSGMPIACLLYTSDAADDM